MAQRLSGATRGPLDKKIWKDAVDRLGTEGATIVVHEIAYYQYMAVFVNGFDIKLPIT